MDRFTTLRISMILMVVFFNTINGMNYKMNQNNHYNEVQDDSIVQTENGQIQGLLTETGRAFLGIPFAGPPTGANRWTPPTPVTSWSGVRNTSQWSAGCPQFCGLPPHLCPAVTSEDCLYLNVYTPSVKNLNTPQPVMVFIHGGRFEQGAAGTVLYDGGFMSNRSNVIIVTLNYRLGVLGWLALDNEITGNFGLMDQRQALQWVQNNIKNFGGNPNQVTIFGQSAGATSVFSHIISPVSKGLNLFQQAIVESSPVTLPNKPLSDAITLGQIFAKDAGCPNFDINCLRNVTTYNVIVAATNAEGYINYFEPLEMFMPWTPTVDNVQLTGQVMDVLASGNYEDVPVIIGTCSEEVLMFIYLADSNPLTDAEYLAAIAAIWLQDSPKVAAEYPPNPIFGDKRPEISVLGTDYIFLGSNRQSMMSILSSNQTVYNYQFTHIMQNDIWGPQYQFCVGHVCHGSELPFVFHAYAYNFTETPGNAENELSLSMVDYWTNFARSGNPNEPVPVSLQWPQYDSVNMQSMDFDTPNSIITNYRGSYLDFWDSIGYNWGW